MVRCPDQGRGDKQGENQPDNLNCIIPPRVQKLFLLIQQYLPIVWQYRTELSSRANPADTDSHSGSPVGPGHSAKPKPH